MKAIAKLWSDLVGWRWAPAVGLSVASLLYVLVVVALVPEEIGVPMTNARFSQKRAPAEAPEAPTYPTSNPDTEMQPMPPPAPVQPAGAVDFGRRGFSPPLERAEPPPAPVVPPPPMVPPAVAVAPPPAPEHALAAAAAAPPPDAPPEAAPPAPSATPPPVLGGLMRSMQALRGVVPNLPANPAPGAPPSAAPTAPGQQQPPDQTAPPAPGRCAAER
jgi:hypothetical protein